MGLGLGGDGKGNHRIWIDENLKGEGANRINNYCDETYELGFILEPHIDTINVRPAYIYIFTSSLVSKSGACRSTRRSRRYMKRS